MTEYRQAVCIFRRDLRLEDHKALQAACAQAEQVICLFVVDPRFAAVGRQFAKSLLVDALAHLEQQLHKHQASLWLAYGSPEQALAQLSEFVAVDSVFANLEYTPQGRQRDQQLSDYCQQHNIALQLEHDSLLFPPGFIAKADGAPYTVFTPFFKRALQYPVESSASTVAGEFLPAPSSLQFNADALRDYWQLDRQPDNALSVADMHTSIMEKLAELHDYDEVRDIPALESTSGLSPLLKLGVISIRQCYQLIAASLGQQSPLLRQLYWRDFYYHIIWHFPHAMQKAFKPQYDAIAWQSDNEALQRWQDGLTGFPIVDAGMRQLRQTGFMHNRVRMIVASFLVKDLHLDWRLGEAHFKNLLIDYDSAVNNGNWQWAASTGCDAQPYFRIFNPWRQQQRFDPDCAYIKRWLPELRELSAKAIHALELSDEQPAGYPSPMVNHKTAAEQAKALFKACA